MSVEWVAAIAASGTFIVIAVSAALAFVQLRHMRTGNQITALSDIHKMYNAHEMIEPGTTSGNTCTSGCKTQKFASPCCSATSRQNSTSYKCWLTSSKASETLVQWGILDRNIACDLWRGVVMNNWHLMSDYIVNRRIALDAPAMYGHFEYLAVISEDWDGKYSGGVYPAGLRRMPAPVRWPELAPEKSPDVS